jgi:hypothetical protein
VALQVDEAAHHSSRIHGSTPAASQLNRRVKCPTWEARMSRGVLVSVVALALVAPATVSAQRVAELPVASGAAPVSPQAGRAAWATPAAYVVSAHGALAPYPAPHDAARPASADTVGWPTAATSAPTPVRAPRRARTAFTLGGAAVGATAVLGVMTLRCGGCGGGGSYLAIGAVGGAYTGALWGGVAGRMVDRARERRAAERARARGMGIPDV